MYCPKCNLHIEENDDTCPLCGGPVTADEEMRKRTAQSGSKAGEWTRELIVEKAKEILGEKEIQEVLHLEESGEGKTPPPRTEGPLFEQENLFSRRDDAPSDEKPGSKKYPLIVGGGILIILVLAVLGYFFLFPSEEPPTPAGIKVPATKKEFAHTKPLASQKTVAKEQKETTETTLQEPDEEKASLQPEEPASSFSDEDVEEETNITAETPEIPITTEIRETSETPEAPETPVPPTLFPGSEEKYSIHVGSFKIKENAFDLRDKLQNKGYPVLCSLAPIPGKGEWYRVEVGYYASPEAQQVVSKLESEEKFTTLSLIEH
jgi:cell division septation protein DedD